MFIELPCKEGSLTRAEAACPPQHVACGRCSCPEHSPWEEENELAQTVLVGNEV